MLFNTNLDRNLSKWAKNIFLHKTSKFFNQMAKCYKECYLTCKKFSRKKTERYITVCRNCNEDNVTFKKNLLCNTSKFHWQKMVSSDQWGAHARKREVAEIHSLQFQKNLLVSTTTSFQSRLSTCTKTAVIINPKSLTRTKLIKQFQMFTRDCNDSSKFLRGNCRWCKNMWSETAFLNRGNVLENR